MRELKPWSEQSLIQILEEAIGLSSSVCSEYCAGRCNCSEYREAVDKFIQALTNGK